jgi:hypothetical protein
MMRIEAALMLLLMSGTIAGSARGQEEPPLLEPTPPTEQPSPTPPPVPAKPPTALPTPPARAPVTMKPLSDQLNFARWQEMSARERQTFVEGAVAAMGAVTSRLRTEINMDGRIPPERLAAVVRFIHDNSPRRAAAAYLKEMETLYATPEGQKLPMVECFLQAFGRANTP